MPWCILGGNSEVEDMSQIDYWLNHPETFLVKLEKEHLPKQPLGLSNESLFHLPLIACIVLALSRQRRPLRTHEVGQIVGECMERTFIAFKGSAQYLGWSTNLRVRTVAALAFLEASSLVLVNENSHITATLQGRKLIDFAKQQGDDLAMTISTVQRVYRDVIAERSSQMDLT
jgi:hypothetical protein